MEQESMNHQQVQEWLAQIEVGQGMHHENLTVFPVFWRGKEEVPADSEEVPADSGDEAVGSGGAVRYQLLSDAVEAKEALVEEVSEGGDVPFLGVKNDGAMPILIPEGEILIGAKQNRVVNLTVLVAAKTTFKLPVSCVEQGRWHYRSREFKPAAFAHPKLRDLKVRSAQRSRRDMGLAMADQGGVWNEVEHHLDDFDAASPTRDVMESYDAAGDQLEGYRLRIELPDGACGFVAAREGCVVGLDLFDNPKTMHKMWGRIADAYFIEAARARGKTDETPKAAATSFIKDVAEHLVEAGEQPDLGLELEVANDRLSGSALFYEGVVCHLSAFNSAPPSL